MQLLHALLAQSVSAEIEKLLIATQHHLFNIGGELSAPQCALTKSEDIDWLENWIDALNANLQPLKEFILPGGDPAVAHCHLARTVCRRAERNVVEWSREHEVRPELIQYMNRLSDLLFVVARVIETENHSKPTYWSKDLRLPRPEE